MMNSIEIIVPQSEKVIALKNGIVEECRKQGFTLNEFERLVESLNWVAEQTRRDACTKTLL